MIVAEVQGACPEVGAPGVGCSEGLQDVLETSTYLPEEFWESRDVLRAIRQAARSKMIGPDGLLNSVFARLSALAVFNLRLPGDGPGSLNYFGALVGRPGEGKSLSMHSARDVLPYDLAIDSLPVGTGEGLIEAYFEWVSERGDDGKPNKVKRQTKRQGLFFEDEGEALFERGGRSGSTLLPTLRSAFTGAVIGQTNASEDRKRHLPAGSYRLSLVVGLQPGKAAPLLGDVAGGTPQRFIYLRTRDPFAPDDRPGWPGSIQLWEKRTINGSLHGEKMTWDAEVDRLVHDRRIAVLRGHEVSDGFTAHRDFLTLKVAGLLALLEDRYHVSMGDWQLAGMVVTTSDNVRKWIMDLARLEAQSTEKSSNDRAARREIGIDEAKRKSTFKRMCDSALNHISNNVCSGCTRTCVNQSIAGRDKRLIPMSKVLDHLKAEGKMYEDQNGVFVAKR